jgi:Na+-driven multidrug efflux pump
MLGYSLWDLMGQFCASGTGQVENILINIFFGARFNAARTLAYTIESKVDQFNGQFITSVIPQITKSYASGDHKRFFELIFESGRFSFYLMLILSLPIFLEAEYLLNIWLVEVPPVTTIFLRFILLSFLIRSPSRPLVAGIHATGDVKFLNLTSGLHVILTYCPAIYLLYKCDFPVWSCCIVLLYRNVVSTILEIMALKRRIKFDVVRYFLYVYAKPLLIAIMASIVSMLPPFFLEHSFVRLILTCSLSVVACLTLIWKIGLIEAHKQRCVQFCKSHWGNLKWRIYD